MEEIWKDVVGYERYYKVSNLGRIMSFNGNSPWKLEIAQSYKFLTPKKDRGGYFGVKLCNNAIEKSLMIHRLVAIAFIPNPNNLEQVNHIDSDRSNNNVNNLEWVSRRENNLHGLTKKQGTSQYMGVNYDKKRNRWKARIQVNKKAIHIGRFKTEIEAFNAVIKKMAELGITNKYSDHKKGVVDKSTTPDFNKQQATKP